MDKKTKIVLAAINGPLFLLSIVCIILVIILVNALPTQQMAKRWQGESELSFSQISAFIPGTTPLSYESMNTFRTTIDSALRVQLGDEYLPFADAYSCESSLFVSSDRGSATVPVTAVGGNFFDFHPLTLLSGSYISNDDTDLYRVVIDKELAWLLFGSNDVAGMSVKIDQNTFYVAGVIDHEQDYATKKAYTNEMSLFIPYRTFYNMKLGLLGVEESDTSITTDSSQTAGSKEDTKNAPGITCYEIVLPNPVKNYASTLVKEKFPVKGCEFVENSTRFSLSNLFDIIKDFAARVISTSGVAYPYWENAARYTENKAASLVLSAILLVLLPALAFLFYSSKSVIWTGRKLRDEKIPALREKVEENIRIQERKKWEKRHPGESE